MTGSRWLADGGVTSAKGNMGERVPAGLRQTPKGELTLRHTYTGENGKEVYRAPK